VRQDNEVGVSFDIVGIVRCCLASSEALDYGANWVFVAFLLSLVFPCSPSGCVNVCDGCYVLNVGIDDANIKVASILVIVG
jgi:hypothetical protein